MQTGEIMQALKGLSEDALQQIVAEASRLLAELRTSNQPGANALPPLLPNGPLTAEDQPKEWLTPRDSLESAAAADWPGDYLPNGLLSPEEENNVRRIWKSPGGC